MEAVNLGSATVGLKSNSHAVLIALKRASSELSAYQKKIINIDDHIGITISGLTADARILTRYMRAECLNYKYSHDTYLPLNRLVSTLGKILLLSEHGTKGNVGVVGNKMQVCTQRYDRRPYGVGLLVAGFDDKGSHIYQTCPSANYYDCKAMSIGARSQSARTYLEKHLDQLANISLDELVKHGLRALRDTLPPEVDLSTKNVSIGFVGKEQQFKILDEEETAPYLKLIEGEERRGGGQPDRPLAPLR